MAVVVNGKRFVTLADEFLVNGVKVYEAWANGVKYYPEGGAGVPDHIKIVVPPNKTAYKYGENMNYVGMVVKVYDAAGNECYYPDGVIPFADLILPVKKATNYDDSTLYGYEGDPMPMDMFQFNFNTNHGTLNTPISFMEVEIPVDQNHEIGTYWGGDGFVIGLTEYGGIVEATIPSVVSEGVTYRISAFRDEYRDKYIVVFANNLDEAISINQLWVSAYMPYGEKTQGGGTVDWSAAYSGGGNWSGVIDGERKNARAFESPINTHERIINPLVPISAATGEIDSVQSDAYYRALGWYIVYGESFQFGGDGIPVQWRRPQDGKILTDTFKIEITS